MKFTIAFCLLLAVYLFQSQAAVINNNSGDVQGSSPKLRQEEEESETEVDPTTARPPLYPVLANILGAALGANETQVNRTVDRLTLSHNGIDPDVSTTTVLTTEEPESTTGSISGGDGEEDEDEDGDNSA